MHTFVAICRTIIICITLISLPTFAVEPFSRGTEGLLFTVKGSNTIGAHLAPNWAKAWMESKGTTNVTIRPTNVENEYRVTGANRGQNIYINLHAHGSSTGFKGLLDGTADIAMSSRAIKAKEVEALSSYGDMKSFSAEHVVAIDGLAVIVNPSNPINRLSVDEVAQIFAGKITNWLELGGPNQPIHLYARDNQSGTWDTFKNLVLAKQYTLSSTAKRFESNDDLSNNVASDRAGIGFVGLASVNDSKALAISDNNTSALKPETIYVATEDYPLSRRLFMYTPERINNRLVEEFIGFAHSNAGQTLVEDIGFVSQNPKKLKITDASGPDEYQALSQYAERLSLNFRFKTNESQLDNKALQDIVRLSHYLKSNELADIQVQLVGFSDTKSSSSRADVLSRLRASAVKIELFRNGIKSNAVMGYGSDVLVANSQGASGSKNDRVEVWLYR